MAAMDTPVGGMSVLIVEDDTLVGVGIGKMLERLGHKVAGHASTVEQAQQIYRQTTPQVVLMDIRLGDSDGIALAETLLAERKCAVVIVSAYSDRELIRRASAAGVFGYLIKPVTLEALSAQIEVAATRFGEQQELVRQKTELEQTLETRKLVEKAKGIFMKRLGLDEAEAHRKLQLEAQKRRINMNQMARKIIEMEELLEESGNAGAAGSESKKKDEKKKDDGPGPRVGG